MNYVHFAQAGLDVALSVGQVDITHLINAAGAAHPLRTEARITHRYMMSLGTFVQLRRQMDDIVQQMEAKGVRLPDSAQIEATE